MVDDNEILRMQQYIFLYAKSKMRNREDAEEVTQETLIQAVLKKQQLRNPTKLRSWLLSICTSILCKFEKRTQSISIEDMSLFTDTTDKTGIKWKDYSVKLRNACELLTPEHRNVIQLKYINGLSMQEIASIEELSKSTVKSRLFEARKAIKTIIEQDNDSIDFLDDNIEEYVMEQVSTVRGAAEMFARLSLSAQQKLCRLAFEQTEFDADIIKAIKDTGHGEAFLHQYKKHVLFDEIIRIMNHCDPFVEKRVIGDLDLSDPEFSLHIKQNMFVFNDLSLLDEKALAVVIKKAGEDTIKTAIQTADIRVKEKLLAQLSPEKQKEWRTLDIINTIDEQIIAEKQIEIVELVYQLHRNGQLIAERTGPEEITMTAR